MCWFGLSQAEARNLELSLGLLLRRGPGPWGLSAAFPGCSRELVGGGVVGFDPCSETMLAPQVVPQPAAPRPHHGPCSRQGRSHRHWHLGLSILVGGTVQPVTVPQPCLLSLGVPGPGLAAGMQQESRGGGLPAPDCGHSLCRVAGGKGGRQRRARACPRRQKWVPRPAPHRAQ